MLINWKLKNKITLKCKLYSNIFLNYRSSLTCKLSNACRHQISPSVLLKKYNKSFSLKDIDKKYLCFFFDFTQILTLYLLIAAINVQLVLTLVWCHYLLLIRLCGYGTQVDVTSSFLLVVIIAAMCCCYHFHLDSFVVAVALVNHIYSILLKVLNWIYHFVHLFHQA